MVDGIVWASDAAAEDGLLWDSIEEFAQIIEMEL